MASERQSSTLPPPQPSYILRGHASQIHSVQFVRQNARLITGDADGWVVYWKLETKRALAVWKAHDGAILGTAEWGHDKIITHGRDNNLRIWQMRAADESLLSTVLPAEVTIADRPKPWLLHALPVNTLNFCAFSMCYEHIRKQTQDSLSTSKEAQARSDKACASILVAVPARDDKKAEVYQFPDERLKYVVPRAQSKDTGMVMAVKLIEQPTTQHTIVITGYEGGLTAVHLLPRDDSSVIGVAQLMYLSQPHTQPILSLDVLPDVKTYFTSGADAIIAAHRIPDLPFRDIVTDTSTSIQEDRGDQVPSTSAQEPKPAPLISSDGVNAGGDLHIVYSDDPPISVPEDDPPTSVPEDSIDPPLSFGKRPIAAPQTQPQQSTSKAGGLSSLLSSASPQSKVAQTPRPLPTPTVQAPLKFTNTKHAGQQSLSVRSDGRLLVTGGWDTGVRIYSTKTLKEVAVLKWHKEGIYAVAFGKMLEAEALERGTEDSGGGEESGEVVKRETGLGRLQRQREEKMQMKHWVAAGAKDGKISLWEIF